MEAVVRKLHALEQQASSVSAPMPPKLLQDVTLHEYQTTGVAWLLAKRAQGINPILGDEMGLGKTLQVIAFVAALVEAAEASTDPDGGRYLVVAPLSVLPNWMDQFARFAPSIETMMYIGPQKDRAATQRTVAASRTQPMVVVTSYEMLLFDFAFFGAVTWELLVLDEGHRLKNPRGKLYEVVTTHISVAHKLVLSGTPIQNDLEELFALLSLLNPTLFDDQTAFETAFREYFSAKAQRLDQEEHKSKRLRQAEELMHRLLSPLLLLRTVQDVQDAFTLPPLSEMVVHTPLSPMQRVYYKEVIARNADAINGATRGHSSRVSLLNILPQLRKACNHPYLFPGAEPEPFEEGSHLYENSGKLFVLHQILPRLKADGHCVLLFSQSTAFLDIIQDFLTLESFAYERIDGSVRGKERWQSIERFRSDPETFVFLISTRSGGVGLNLQRADTVIFADSDYNPQADLQAVARAYRLGQTKPIHVIKFLCANTVEESIYRRSLKKKRMADRIRNIARRTNQDDGADVDSDESLMDMIQFGLHKLMEEAASEDEDALVKPLEEEYIRHILARKSMDDVTEAKTRPSSTVEDDTGAFDKAASLKNEKLLEAGGDFREENMYYFEGEDYSKATESKTQDVESFLKLCREAKANPKRQTKVARARYDAEEDEEEEDEEQAAENEAERVRKREERRQRAREKKLAKWRANNYNSAAINVDSDMASSPSSREDNGPDSDRRAPGRLNFKTGDASHPPAESLRSSAYIIVHCVDTSGVWCPRGFFRSLSALSPVIQQQYEAAGRNGDLKLGSAHLIRLPSEATAQGYTYIDGYVCLLVVQGFVGKKKQRVDGGGHAAVVRRGKSTTFRLGALETALQALAQRALALDANVHLPRIGYGTPNFNWYAVERLLARHLRDAGVNANIYYYSRNRS